MFLLWILSVLAIPALSNPQRPAKRTYDTHAYYVLEHNPDGLALEDVLKEFEVELVEQVGALTDHWLTRRRKDPLSLGKRTDVAEDPVVARYNELMSLTVCPRNDHNSQLASSIKSLSLQIPRRRVKRAPPPIPPAPGSSQEVAERLGIKDPLFPEQWHLVNDENPVHMMNVTGVWEMGFTGKGVTSSLIDDGLDYESEDLAANFDAANSHDYNDHEDLPTPKLFDDTHGTRCAGQIAAVKNGVCGIGIAYDSKVAGVRILSGLISDADEAAALNFGYQDVALYSCSWGPPDDGRTMEGPDHLIKKAMLEGINNGRGGKGSIFVFASGNGAASGDQCNFDGYTNSIWSITVSAVDHQGGHPYYSEACAANMIVAYSSGSGKSIVTTDKGKDKCSSTHGGTSAAAPNAVGVFALALGARPDLTWRDMQYLCVENARTEELSEAGWEKTATGRLYSYKYGYGALDAYRFVNAALKWELVKPQVWFKTHTAQLGGGKMTEDKVFSGGEAITSEGVKSVITVTQDTLLAYNMDKLEHINVKVWIQHSRRGDVQIEVVSPNGIKSMLAGQRNGDTASTGFSGWMFMSVKHWGENAVGDWTIRVWDEVNEDFNGTFLGWNMILWGSAIDATRTKKYVLPMDDTIFPPHDDLPPLPSVSPSTTRTYTKPTVFLEPTTTVQETSAPGLAKLVASQKGFFVSIAFIFMGGIGVAIYFWRRHAKHEHYSALSDDVPMNGLGRDNRGTDREMYDAFGQGEEDDGAADAPLLRREHSGDRMARNTDDTNQRPYRDEPENVPAYTEDDEENSNDSPDGSWIHTS